MHTQDDERLLAWVRRGLVDGVARLVDAVANVCETCDGGDPGQTPCPAQQPEAAPLDLLLVGGDAALLADALAQRNLGLDGTRCPARSAGDQRRALCRVGTAAGRLEEVRRSEGPHGGSH